jgi:translation initiation factor IF-2
MNISTLAKILNVSIKEIRETGQKKGIYGFSGRNTRIPYNSALEVTKILRPDKLSKLENDDKIYIPNTIRVDDLSESIGKPSGMVLKTLMMNGVMVSSTEIIDFDTASLIAEELGVKVFSENPEMFDSGQNSEFDLVKTVEYDIPEDQKTYISRPPVVTVMGHVDHGKTTLLDYIRKSSVASSEAGSITQHISSYKINYKENNITFVDTPGHEAFTAMRARGSQLADFVIIVVSAVEGPKPQTAEVIERCKLSKVQVIVAINKIDLPESDVERVKTELTKFGLVPEEWGGNTPFIPLSAKTGQGVDKLLETILLFAEVASLKGEVNCPGQAIVIESLRDNTKGVMTTVLVVKDEIKVGEIIRSGICVGKIKKLTNTVGDEIECAKIGEPVIILGLPEIADIGEAIIVYKNLKQAQTDAYNEETNRAGRKIVHNNLKASTDNSINVVLKADVSGSLEALKEAIIKIPQEEVKISIKSQGVGMVNESDLDFAETSESTILAFHTKPDNKAEVLINKRKINIVQSDIIYQILEWLESEIIARTKREIRKTVLGQAKVLKTFKSEKPSIQIFGGEVIDGKILDNKPIEVIREGQIIGQMEVQELQRNKFKASEINISQQFGMSVTGKFKVKEGDIIQTIDEQVIM